MAMSKKGTRSINVDGIAYLWKLCSPDYDRIPYTIAVQIADGQGNVLIARLHEYFAVTPSVVAGCIREALAAGWQSTVPGAPFVFASTISSISIQ